MKRAFTMIELVLIIVILGILASIAIPKLTATKDDAGAVKASLELKNALTELATYYNINGNFSADGALNNSTSDIGKMSPTLQQTFSRSSDRWSDCLTLTTNSANATVTVSNTSTSSAYCKAVRLTPAYKGFAGETNGVKVGGGGLFE